MYWRRSISGHRVEWQPSNLEAAEQALKDTPGVPDVELPEEAPVELPRETAAAVQERYRELTEEA